MMFKHLYNILLTYTVIVCDMRGEYDNNLKPETYENIATITIHATGILTELGVMRY